MASAIDITKPVEGNPTTQSVRDNFAAAKNEIEALQTSVANLALQFWTPSATPVTNVSAATAAVSMFVAFGDWVLLAFQINIDPTAAGLIDLDINAPVASAFAAARDCIGTGCSRYGDVLQAYANGSNTIRLSGTVTDAANRTYNFVGAYRIR